VGYYIGDGLDEIEEVEDWEEDEEEEPNEALKQAAENYKAEFDLDGDGELDAEELKIKEINEALQELENAQNAPGDFLSKQRAISESFAKLKKLQTELNELRNPPIDDGEENITIF
jgi:hypothetical protein